MKCPNCGAETNGKFCEYCESELPKDKVNIGICPKCGNSNIIFKRERVSTATKHSSSKNVFGTGRTGHSATQTSYRTIGLCQNCGHTWNPNAGSSGSKRKTWLWVLGWICIFPIPLTILLLRKKDMKPAVKYGVIAVAWLLFFVIGILGSTGETAPNNNSTSPTVSQLESTTEVSSNDTEERNPYAEQEKNIRKFVNEFNQISDTPVTDIEFKKNHTIAYLVVDGFTELSIKVNDHSEMGFFFTLEFSNGTASLEQYEKLMRDIVKVFDANVDVGEKFQEANINQRTIVHLSDNISVEYHYIKDAIGYQEADTYIITLTSDDYNKY